MKWYLTTVSLDWGDEFDVHFGELIDESMYSKYKYLSDVLKSYENFYGFGSNEDFDDFEYLNWDFAEISEEEAKILQKYGLPNGFGFIDRLFENIEYNMMDNNIFYPEDIETDKYGYRRLKEDLYEMPFHKFADYVDKYAKFLENDND